MVPDPADRRRVSVTLSPAGAVLATQVYSYAQEIRKAGIAGIAPRDLARAAATQAGRTGRNLLDSMAEYLLDENPQLVRRAALDGFNAELAHARDALARVEKRVERLEKTVQARGESRSRGPR